MITEYRLFYPNPVGKVVMDFLTIKEYERLINLYPRFKFDYYLVVSGNRQIFNFHFYKSLYDSSESI